MGSKKKAKQRNYGELSRSEALQEVLSAIKEKLGASSNDLISILQSGEGFTTSIFSEKLTVFESIVLHSIHELGYTYTHIATLLHRSPSTIATTAQRASKKQKGSNDQRSPFFIPYSIFESRLSILESVVLYLKSHYHLSNVVIAKLLHRDSRTIWTVAKRGKEKSD